MTSRPSGQHLAFDRFAVTDPASPKYDGPPDHRPIAYSAAGLEKDLGPDLTAVADLESTGQTRAARLAYAAAARRWPDEPTAWLGLGNTEYRSGNLEQARRSYRQAIRADPRYPAAYNNLAEVQADLGCFDAALATLDTALQLVGEAAQRLRPALLATRGEIQARRPEDHKADAPNCSGPAAPNHRGGP